MRRNLFWFRRDLRIEDNVGLFEARQSADELYTVFIVDPDPQQSERQCGDRVQFQLEAVQSLREEIREHGGELIIRKWDHCEVLEELIMTLEIDAVYWNRSYNPREQERDQRVKQKVLSLDVEVETFKDQLLFEGPEIVSQETGQPFRRYTPYAEHWRERTKPSTVGTVNRFEAPSEVNPGEIPDLADLGLERHLDFFAWEPTQQAAHKTLDSFLSNKLSEYDRNSEYPARQSTSRLSPYLRFGLISIRTIYHGCREREPELERPEGARVYRNELIWRDFFYHVLHHFPEVVERNIRGEFDDFPWEDRPGWLEAWKQGQTGFPIVDAGMRQLHELGWMHKRLRMIVSSFLTKHCLIHWKEGERFFMNRMLDGDTACNSGGWQWSASTGIDEGEQVRMLNPISQSRKYDPEGEFIRRYCPELEELPDNVIHAPFEAEPEQLERSGVILGETYPEPLFHPSERQEHSMRVFESMP